MGGGAGGGRAAGMEDAEDIDEMASSSEDEDAADREHPARVDRLLFVNDEDHVDVLSEDEDEQQDTTAEQHAGGRDVQGARGDRVCTRSQRQHGRRGAHAACARRQNNS